MHRTVLQRILSPLCFSVACSKESISSPYLCLDATYIVALLKEGFGFKENRRLTVSIGQNSLFYIIFLPLFTITTTLVKNCLTPRPLYNLPRSINCQLCHRNDLTVKTWENAVQELGKAKYWGVTFDGFAFLPGVGVAIVLVTSCYKTLVKIENALSLMFRGIDLAYLLK